MGEVNESRDGAARHHVGARQIRQQVILVAAVLVVGGVVFCSPGFEEVASAPWTYVLFVATLIAITISALLLRMAYAEHLAARGLRGDGSHTPVRNIVADVATTGALTVAYMKLCEFAFGHPPSLSEWIETFLYSGLAITLDRLLRQRLEWTQAAHQAVPPSAATPSNSPASRQPSADSPQDELHYVEAEDHYVKFVYRDRVEHKRARFRDVIAGLGPSGIRVHKSFWVNCSVVKGSRRAGRRLVLVLQDGTEIPVGRGNERSVTRSLTDRSDGIRANSGAPRT